MIKYWQIFRFENPDIQITMLYHDLNSDLELMRREWPDRYYELWESKPVPNMWDADGKDLFKRHQMKFRITYPTEE